MAVSMSRTSNLTPVGTPNERVMVGTRAQVEPTANPLVVHRGLVEAVARVRCPVGLQGKTGMPCRARYSACPRVDAEPGLGHIFTVD
jgi:hypothetical protein